MKTKVLVILTVLVLMLAGGNDASSASAKPRNVIFFHPDGYGLNHYGALRSYLKGPDGRLNWDRLPYIAPYTGHVKDDLTGSSHGSGTVHAYGVKVMRDSFGMDGAGDAAKDITALSGKKKTIMEEARDAGFATALIQTGSLTEPGTAAFVASARNRDDHAEIAKQTIESGIDVILGGGERWLLPKGTHGWHGAGERPDGVNLIERAKKMGYTVVYTRDELANVPIRRGTKVLGVFAHNHTFNDITEEELSARGLPLYVATAPTIAEMAEVTLKILSQNPKARTKGIFVVAEEEGTDNFGNAANAKGSFEAGKRTDEAFGVFVDFVNKNPNTLLITAADSSAGGKHVISPVRLTDGKTGDADINTVLPLLPGGKPNYVKAPVDGIDGSNTAPFMGAPNKAGTRSPFAIVWATRHDLSDGILVRAKGLNAKRVQKMGVIDNTDIYRLMYLTLFNRWLP